MLARALAIWLVLMGLAIANGALREGLLTPRLGERAGHVLSTLFLCLVIFAVAWLAIRWIAPVDTGAAWTVGFAWLMLTLAFEFLAGHYLFGTPWEKLFADYNVLRGRIWPLVPLATLAAPPLAYWAGR